MVQQLYHIPVTEDECKAIHPSLVPYLLHISFTRLTPDETRRMFDINAEDVFGEFVKNTINLAVRHGE